MEKFVLLDDLGLNYKLIPLFIKETEGLVLDTTHIAYEYLFENKHTDQNISPQDEKELKNIYHSLSIICHSDKCKFPWASDIFIILNHAYHTKSLNIIQELNNHWTSHKTFENFQIQPKNKTKVELIIEWQKQIWFQWFIPGSLVREIFILEAEHHAKLQKKL